MIDNNLVEKWRQVDLEKPPYIFPGDEQLIRGRKIDPDIKSYEEYVARLGEVKEFPNKLHVGLIPVPYVGNLETAKFFILTANPGLGTTNYKGEYDDSKYRKQLIINLRQENFDEYPFMSLNIEFAWLGGFIYWERKFSSIINQLLENQITYDNALRLISNKVACVELVPYHSTKGCGISNLESTKMFKEFVHQVLKPKAQKGEIDIVVIRKAVDWGLENDKHTIVFPANQARSSSLGIDNEGGKRILELLIN
ncbi:MAG: Uncharacterized protein FD147_1212 [Chloroflexi bacterium]|nr:MAG: Uncharacterized protein FD147_1212 [Chloroflexota bacterium]MBA4376951.1 hypothetical protein [Anaerolinea sp.]